MNPQELRSLQESYIQVYELDEELTGPRRERALQILKNAKLPVTPKEKQLSDIISGVEGSESNFKMRETRAMPTKRGGGGIRGERKTGRGSAWNSDRGSGNKAAKRASKANESFDLYDIILSHLLDEGYADTEQAAEVIMVNMSEDWRESIMEGMKPLPVGKMLKQAARHSNPEQVTKMAKVADEHDPKKSKRTEDDNRREGGRKRDAGRPRRNELQDNW